MKNRRTDDAQGGAEGIPEVGDQMMNHGLAFDVHGEGSYEEWRRLTDDPEQLLAGVPVVAARGQRPAS